MTADVEENRLIHQAWFGERDQAVAVRIRADLIDGRHSTSGTRDCLVVDDLDGECRLAAGSGSGPEHALNAVIENNMVNLGLELATRGNDAIESIPTQAWRKPRIPRRTTTSRQRHKQAVGSESPRSLLPSAPRQARARSPGRKCAAGCYSGRLRH